MINDRKLLRMIDKEGMSQSAAAKVIGCSRQAVHQRLQELRGKTTRATVLKKVEAVVDQRLDAVDQLASINKKAFQLLDEAEHNPELALKAMAEIRGQLKLQLEILAALFDLRAAQEFQDEVLAAIGEVAPDVRNRIIHGLNEKKAVRSIAKWH